MIKLTLPQLEQRIQGHDGQIQVIFEAIRECIKAPEGPKKKVKVFFGNSIDTGEM